MLKHKKTTLLVALLFMPLSFVFHFDDAFAITDTLTLGSDYIDIPSERYSNDAGTATFDPDTYTLTLNGYNDGPIIYNDSQNLTVVLKGNNTITVDVPDFLAAFEAADTTKIIDLTFTGDGSLALNGELPMAGITTDSGNIIIDGGNINIKSSAFGLYAAFGDVIINGGHTTIQSGLAGIVSQHAFVIAGGYLDVTGGEQDSGIAILNLDVMEDPAFIIADNMQISPAGISAQSTPIDLGFLGEFTATTLGKAGATINDIDIFSDYTASTTNVAHHVTISEPPVEENPNTFDHITSHIALACISFISLIASVAFARKHRA